MLKDPETSSWALTDDTKYDWMEFNLLSPYILEIQKTLVPA